MARPFSVQPAQIVAIVGKRHAAMYARCRCGGIRARQARRCLACFQDERAARRSA